LTPSPFDEFLLGNQDALSAEAKIGLQTFIRLGCTACHNGVNVGTNSFQKFGLHGNYWEHTGSTEIDAGREQVTQDEADRYFFRVASLRNVEKTAPYFHDGSVETLEEAVRVMVRIQLGMELTDQQVSALAAFLRSLTGEVPIEAQQSVNG
jgi:cytochrome c peroxidase